MKWSKPQVVFAASLFALAASGLLRTQKEAIAGKQTKPHEIEGDWTWLFEQGEGITPIYFNTGSRWFPVTHASVWRFSNGKMKTGWPTNDDPRWKWNYSNYQLDTEKKSGTMDLVNTGVEGENNQYKSKAIYLIKDDWLFICEHKEKRPDNFAASKAGENLYVFRRGVLPPIEDVAGVAEMRRLCVPTGQGQQKKQADANAKLTIEGNWMEFLREFGGIPSFVRFEKRRDGKALKEEDQHVMRVWKFSKDMAEKGIDDGTFPLKDERWRYRIDPKAKPATIDAILVDKAGKEYPRYQWKAIYEIIDHHLLICVNAGDAPVRPERFTTSAKTTGTTLYILRRAK